METYKIGKLILSFLFPAFFIILCLPFFSCSGGKGDFLGTRRYKEIKKDDIALIREFIENINQKQWDRAYKYIKNENAFPLFSKNEFFSYLLDVEENFGLPLNIDFIFPVRISAESSEYHAICKTFKGTIDFRILLKTGKSDEKTIRSIQRKKYNKLSPGMLSCESDYFLINFPEKSELGKNTGLLDRFIESRQKTFSAICTFLSYSWDIKTDGKICFYIFDDDKQAQKYGYTTGFASPETNSVYIRLNQTKGHELAHIIAFHSSYSHRINSPLVNEGLSTLLDQSRRDYEKLSYYFFQNSKDKKITP